MKQLTKHQTPNTKHQTPNTNWQLTKFLTVLVMLFLFVTSCEYDDGLEILQTEASQSSFKVKTVKLEEIPKIKDFLNSKTNNIFYKEITDKDGAIFDTENILEVMDTLNYANYSFRFVYPDTPVSTFYNLVVGKTPEGEAKEPFVLKYVCDESHLDGFIINDFNLQYFKGKVGVHKYTDFFEDGNFYKGDTYCPENLDANGDPIPCDKVTLDGSNPNGGGSENEGDPSGGDTSGGDTSGDDSTSGDSSSNTSGGGGSNCTWDVEYIPTRPCPYTDDLASCLMPYLVIDCGQFYKSTTVKKGDTTSDCPECPKPDGGIGINTTAIDINTILGDILNDDQLLWLSTNTEEEAAIKQFLKVNIGKEANEFVELAINTWIDNSEFSLRDFNNFSQFIPDFRAKMTVEELQIFDNMSTTKQTRYLYNAHVASEKAKELFPGVQINNNADAFRHAYFHGLNTYFIGYDLSVQLGDAHESETPDVWILEKVMDTYNNEVGRGLAQNPTIMMNGYGVLLIRISNAIQNGNLVYLNPIDYNDPALNNNPDFWDNQNTTKLGDGNHGISTSTILTPTS